MANNYNIPAYGPNSGITIAAGTINTTLSLKLVGRGAPGYGYAFAENAFRQLTNFANDQAPEVVISGSTTMIGQLWFDTKANSLKVYTTTGWQTIFGESNSAGVKLTADQGGTGLTPSPYVDANNPGDANKVLQVNPAGSGYVLTSVDNLGCVLTYKSTSPTSDSAVSLGDSTHRFKEMYVATVNSTTVNSANLNGATVTATTVNATNVTASNVGTAGTTVYQGADYYGTTFHGVATSAQFADLAERYESDEPLEAGDVVELGGSKEIRKTTTANSNDVFGVISTAPAYMMNSQAGDDATHPYVALVGRAPVKVIGKVRKGQRLVSSNFPGVARAVELWEVQSGFQVIGRALADKESDDLGTIEATLGAK